MEQGYSLSLIALLKGIVYNHQKEIWENLLQYEPDVKKYFQPIGVELFLDKSEGYAFLKQKEWEEEDAALPRLTEKRQLNFMVSLLCIVRIVYHASQFDTTRTKAYKYSTLLIDLCIYEQSFEEAVEYVTLAEQLSQSTTDFKLLNLVVKTCID